MQHARGGELFSGSLDFGLIEWVERLSSLGYERLFPELLFNVVKGFSKPAVKWFSSYLKRLGWTRNGTKVFHSFRHTLASKCLNELGCSEAMVSQITGHARGESVLASTYRKDVLPSEALLVMDRVEFIFPAISKFDIDAGAAALNDALRRRK
jgi:integrase